MTEELIFYRDNSELAIKIEKSLIEKINAEGRDWTIRRIISDASHKIPLLCSKNILLRGYYDIVTRLNLYTLEK